MKTVIKVFEIISIVCKTITTIGCLIYAFACFAASKTIIDQLIQNGTAKNEEEAKVALVATGIYLIIAGLFTLFGLILSIVTLKKLKTLTKRPIALGILNILFASLISGICLLILDPTAPTYNNEYNNYR